MITLRRAEQRRHVQRRKHEVWHTFYPEGRAAPFEGGFCALEVFDENRLPPGAELPLRLRRDAEIVTYVAQGALADEDSNGRSGVIHAGEFQCITAKSRVRYSQTNVSRTEWAQVFHLWLRPAEAALEPSCAQKRFYAADRRGVLCVVASPDGRRGSLPIHQDAVLYSALLDPGQHLVHEFAERRDAWLHVVHGRVRLGEVVLTTGDGAAISADRAVSVTASEESEILLLDLQERAAEALTRTRGRITPGA